MDELEAVDDWTDIPDEEAPAGVLETWRVFAALRHPDAVVREVFGVKIPGEGARRLARYWERGKGAAKVLWGTEGAMERCIALNKDHMRDPGGYCAKRHKAVTGEWPTEHGKAGIPS
jgi:hypothetical protein